MQDRDSLPAELREELDALEAGRPHRAAAADMPKRSFAGVERGRFYRPIKKSLSIRLDADVLDHFVSQGAGYQTRINAALRRVMEQAVAGSKPER